MRIFYILLITLSSPLWGKEMMDKQKFLSLSNGQQLRLIKVIQQFSIHSDHLTVIAPQVSFAYPYAQNLNAYADTPPGYLKKIATIDPSKRCLVGGWISEYNSAQDKCKDPRWIYRGIFPQGLPSTKFQCNPILFGGDFAVNLPRHSYNDVSLNCYKLAGNNTKDILKNLKNNQNALAQFIEIAKITLKSCLCDTSNLMNEKYQDRIFHHSTCAGLLAQVSLILDEDEKDEQCVALNSKLDISNEFILELRSSLSKISSNFSIDEYKKYIGARTNSAEYCDPSALTLHKDAQTGPSEASKSIATDSPIKSESPDSSEEIIKDEVEEDVKADVKDDEIIADTTCSLTIKAEIDNKDESAKTKVKISATLSEICPQKTKDIKTVEITETLPAGKTKDKEQAKENKTSTITLTREDDKKVYGLDKSYPRELKDYVVKYSKDSEPKAETVEVTIKKTENSNTALPQMAPSRPIQFFKGSM